MWPLLQRTELPCTAFESFTKCLILKHIQEGKYLRNIRLFGENIHFLNAVNMYNSANETLLISETLFF